MVEPVQAATARWIDVEEQPRDSALEARCTQELLQNAIADLGDLTVVSARLQDTGKYDVPRDPDAPEMLAMGTPGVVEGLPPFCEVKIEARGPGGHVTKITVWVPLNWHGRFFGSTAGGTRTGGGVGGPLQARAVSMVVALRNGFATATTDGGVRDTRLWNWGLKPGTNEVDMDLTDNWIHRSTHEMTVVAKAVIEAIHGVAPSFSYMSGTSGGGRQTLKEAQRYPDDYDGLWASDSAFRWTQLLVAEVWPAVVMKESGVVLGPAKLEAFRRAAIEASDGIDGLRDGVVGAFDPVAFEPKQIVGQSTAEGPITDADAEVMAKIWEGPRRRNGEFLWWGVHPSTMSWVPDEMPFALMCSSVPHDDGTREAVPFQIGADYIGTWVVKDRDWDWHSLTYENYEEIWDQSVREWPELATDDPDLRAFRDAGGKLIISQGMNDPMIPYQGAVDYYRNVIGVIGSEDETRKFARLFVTEGDGHNNPNDPGPGLHTADVLTALIKWVEEGEAPDEIIARTFDAVTGEQKADRPAYPYPLVPEYVGEGDGTTSSSFKPVHFSTRERR